MNRSIFGPTNPRLGFNSSQQQKKIISHWLFLSGKEAMSGQGSGIEDLYPLVSQLTNPDLREVALLELSKKRESYPDLALVLWHSPGTVAALLQEIVSIYAMLAPPTLTPAASNRVCNALALLQCVASHAETKTLLMNGAELEDADCGDGFSGAGLIGLCVWIAWIGGLQRIFRCTCTRS